MTPVVRGLIFAGIGIVVQLVCWLALLRPLLDLSWTATAVLTVIGIILAGLFGFLTGLKGIYALEPRPVWVFILDVGWSAINTITGLFWMIWCAAKGTYQPPTRETQKRGIIVFSGAALPGAAASTIGTVLGGRWLIHEAVHVQQARIFGPFYWPLYLLNYAANMLVRFLTGRFRDPHWEAYGRVLMEDWAYRAAPHDSATSVEVLPSVLWFLLSLLNVLAIGVLVAGIPVLGALPALLGLAVIPWWVGLIVLILYALGRSFFAKADDHGSGLVFA